MGQSTRKSVIITSLLAAAAAGLAGTAAAGSLPGWTAVAIAAMLGAGLAGGLIQWRLLSPLTSLHAELRSSLLGSSIFFDAATPDGSDSGEDPRDPMLHAVDRFKHMAEQMADHGNQIAINAAELSFAAQQRKSDAQQGNQGNCDVSAAVNRIEGAMNALAQSAAQAAVCAARADQAGTSGQRALSSATQQMHSTSMQIQDSTDRVTALSDSSDRIERAFGEINSIAQQTELLALNAMHEAARAGEHGRSFAVAADEVSGMAQKTTAATHEIGNMLAQMGSEIRAAATTLSGLTRALGEGVVLSAEASEHLADVLVNADTAHKRMQAVSEGASANWEELAQISSSHKCLGSSLQGTGSLGGLVARQAQQLSSTAEIIHGQVVTLGGQTQHAHMRFVAQSVAQSIGQAFEQGLDDQRISEPALFDHDDTRLAEGDPLQSETPFEDFAKRVLPTALEPVLELNPELSYIGIVDNNGRFPDHNRRYTAPQGDEHQVEIADNGNHQVLSELIDNRSGSNTEPFLLQTYKTDSAQVMHDLSAPIYVNGRHWGGFHLGYRAQSD